MQLPYMNVHNEVEYVEMGGRVTRAIWHENNGAEWANKTPIRWLIELLYFRRILG